jgi:hypothetical protein
MPLPHIHLIIDKPVKSSVSVLHSIFECSNIGVSVALEFIPQSATFAIMIISLENVAVVEKRD